MPDKGPQTRAAILDRATTLASRIGLDGLSVSTLAAATEMSKSGLYAHFGSKEELQVAILETAAAQFERAVVRPCLEAPRGEPRLHAFLDLWLQWAREVHPEGGCVFLQATVEFDDQPGRVRDTLERQQRELLAFLAGAVERAVGEGHFRADVDPLQIAFEIHALTMGYHHALRMMRDPAAEKRVRFAFASLCERSRVRVESAR